MPQRQDNVFNSVQSAKIERNRFDLSHDVKLSFKMGSLIPITCLEVLPGDSFEIDFVNMLRFAPLIAPVMHRVKVYTEYFFVPNRILWPEWEDFITGVGEAPQAPVLLMDGITLEGSLADYFGLPTGSMDDTELNINVLPFAAYLKIYDDWYRYAPVITEKLIFDIVPGQNPDIQGFVQGVPLNRAWEHDYFTSALPTTQQGSPVDLPLTFADNVPVLYQSNNNPWIVKTTAGGNAGGFDLGSENATPSNLENIGGGQNLTLDPNGTLYVNVQSEAATLNDLREALALQSFLERTLRGGVRYIEQIWAHFNVKSSDARLQRPEFIGRAVQNMTISEVLSTAQSSNDPATANVPVGQMAGHGISVGGSNKMHYTAEEHGFIIGIISVIPETAYQDGVRPMWTRYDRYDYAWPSFAHLGERPIKLQELLTPTLVPSQLETVFGYIPTYSEYRYEPSRVAGQMRTTLDFWHLGRQFDPENPPTLSEDFISVIADENTGLTRIFAVTDPTEDHIFAHVLNDIKVSRKLPRFGVPQLVG